MDAPLKLLYRQLVVAAKSFKDRNFREYFLRITRDDFRKARPDNSDLSVFMTKQQSNLEGLKRQVLVQNMFFSEGFSVKR